jgi:hypothetical protein
MSYHSIYSKTKLCPDTQCDRYCEIDKCFPNKMLCIEDNKCSNAASKVCPPMMCNFAKQNCMNRTIYERNMAVCPMDIIPDYRSEFKMCGDSYLDKNTTPKLNLTNRVEDYSNIKNCMEQGKGNMINYLRNIDVDSELKRYPYRWSLCNEPKHQKPNCPDFCVDKPIKNEEHYIKNSQFYNQLRTDNLVPIRNINPPVSCRYSPFNMVDVNIQREYPSNNDPCTFVPTRMTDQNTDSHKKYNLLVAGNYTLDMNTAPVLKLGPERCDNQVNNLWNNNTKRRYNSDTLEHHM